VDSPLSEEQPLWHTGDLTLRRLAVWAFEPQMRMKCLAAVAEACKNKKGGALASCIHGFLQHGDPRIRETVKSLLRAVSFFKCLVICYCNIFSWLFETKIIDSSIMLLICIQWVLSSGLAQGASYPHRIYLENAVFWDVTPCGSCKNRRFEGTWRLHHQGEKNQ
jgi:hypothetical protein